MKFEEAINNQDVLNIAASALKRYKGMIPPHEMKYIRDFAIWRACENYNSDKSSFTTYVYNRVVFACKDHIKGIMRERKEAEKLQNAISSHEIPSYYLNTSIEYTEIVSCITNEEDKKLINMAYLENTPISQIAESMNKTPAQVANKIKNIIKKLKMSINS